MWRGCGIYTSSPRHHILRMVSSLHHHLIIPSLDTSGDVMWCASHGGDVDAIKGCDVDTIMRDTVMETSTVHTMGYTTIPIMGCASLHILWDGVVCISPHLLITTYYGMVCILPIPVMGWDGMKGGTPHHHITGWMVWSGIPGRTESLHITTQTIS